MHNHEGLQVVEKQEAILTLELSEAAHFAGKAGASFYLDFQEGHRLHAVESLVGRK